MQAHVPQWFEFVMDGAFKSALIFSLAWGVATAMNRASAAARHLVWFSALVAALTVPSMSKILPDSYTIQISSRMEPPKDVIRSSHFHTEIDQTIGTLSDETVNSSKFEFEKPQRIQQNVVPEVETTEDSNHESAGPAKLEAQIVATTGSKPRRSLNFGFIWFGGAAAMCLFYCLAGLNLILLSRKSILVDSGCLRVALDAVSKKSGLRRKILLLKNNQQPVPMTWGVFFPRLLLPADAVNWCQERLRAVLLHEVAHIRRLDFASQFVGNLAKIVYWYHPLVWIASKHLAHEQELASDDVVLSQGIRRSDYAAHLLAIASTLSTNPRMQSTAIAMARESQLTDRIKIILDSNRNPQALRPMAIFSLVAVFLMIQISLSTITLFGQNESNAVQNTSTTSIERAEKNYEVRMDAFGDELPKHAIFRLGTTRFRQSGEIENIAYGPDGELLATTQGNSIILWDAKTGIQKRRLKPSNQMVDLRFQGLCFSPDGAEISATNGYHTYIWEVATGVELLRIKSKNEFLGIDGGQDLAYSPDGTQLAVGGGMLAVYIYDTTTAECNSTLSMDGHRALFYGIAWTRDGKHLAAGTLEPSAVVWNVETGELERKFEVKKDRQFTSKIALSKDNKLLLGSSQGSIHVWDFDSGEFKREIQSSAKYIHKIALSDNNDRLIIGSQDGKIRIWDFKNDKLIHELDGKLWIGRSTAITSDFSTVALGAVYPTIRQWDVQSGMEKYPQPTSTGHDAEVLCVAYSPDGKWIASGGANHQIHVWSAFTGEQHIRLPSESSAAKIVFDNSSTKIYTFWEHKGVVRVWDIATQKIVQTFDRGEKKLRAFAFSQNGKTMFTVGTDSKYGWHSTPGQESFHAWDTSTGKHLYECRFDTSSTESAAVDVRKGIIVTGSANGEIHVMDLKTGENLQMLFGHRHTVDHLVFNLDRSLLISGSTDQTIRIWDTTTWKTKRVLKGHQRAITSLALSIDGTTLASASGKQSYPIDAKNSPRIRLWNISSGKQIGYFEGHNVNTSAITFSPKGDRLVSAHANTNLLVWETAKAWNH